MSIKNWKGNRLAILAYGMLAIGVILIIYDEVALFLEGGGMRFAHATYLSIIGLVLCIAGLILIRELK